MTRVNSPITSDDLQALVDGELDAERSRAVEAYLAETPEAAGIVSDWRRQADMLKALYGGPSREETPARLDPYRLARQRRSVAPTWRNVAAAVGFLCLGTGLGWGAASALSPREPALNAMVTMAVEAHHLYSDDRVRPVELDASQSPVLQKWLSRRLDRTINLPDLRSFELQFVGGRLLPNGDGPAAQLMYEDATGRRVTLYVAPNAGEEETSFLHTNLDRLEAVFWNDETIRCAVVGDLPLQRLQTIAKAAYRQLI